MIFVSGVVLLAQPQPKSDQAAVERGRSQFKSSCGFCHGDDATGNRGPDLIRSSSLAHDNNGDVLAPIIRNGRADQGMPAFATLPAAQIADIVTFLHFQAYSALNSNSVPNDYPLAKLLTGNAEAGQKYFNGAGGCSGCHSATGDLRGAATKYRPLELQQRFIYPSRGAVPTATVKAGADTFEGRVVHDDEFEIAITAKDGWYRSWPRDQVQVEIHDPLAAHRALMTKYTDADIHNLFAYLETLK
ncbi:MAG TPA: cytochrome c [Bryobacteraceae bacterium]|nr:cytochrome c [Bryobacteraceae bacterium]